MIDFTPFIEPSLRDIVKFCEHASGLKLRSYQVEVAQEIIESVKLRDGRSIVVMFPRQSGKNELQAQIETYLLLILGQIEADLAELGKAP